MRVIVRYKSGYTQALREVIGASNRHKSGVRNNAELPNKIAHREDAPNNRRAIPTADPPDSNSRRPNCNQDQERESHKPQSAWAAEHKPRPAREHNIHLLQKRIAG